MGNSESNKSAEGTPEEVKDDKHSAKSNNETDHLETTAVEVIEPEVMRKEVIRFFLVCCGL
jgi:hypothetical protein